VPTLLLYARRYKPATAVTKGRMEAPAIVVDISAPQFPWRTGFRNSFNSSAATTDVHRVGVGVVVPRRRDPGPHHTGTTKPGQGWSRTPIPPANLTSAQTVHPARPGKRSWSPHQRGSASDRPERLRLGPPRWVTGLDQPVAVVATPAAKATRVNAVAFAVR